MRREGKGGEGGVGGGVDTGGREMEEVSLRPGA